MIFHVVCNTLQKPTEGNRAEKRLLVLSVMVISCIFAGVVVFLPGIMLHCCKIAVLMLEEIFINAKNQKSADVDNAQDRSDWN